MPATGKEWLLEVDGCLHVYHHEDDLFLGDRLVRRLRAEQGWFEKLTSHAPTVGTFYEDALRDVLNEVLPANFKSGTGFVFKPQTKTHSKQIDILIYDDSRAAPLYRRGNFVIVIPASGAAYSEVKKTLRPSDLRELIHVFSQSRLGTHIGDVPGCHRIVIFTYGSKSTTDRLFEHAIETLKAHTRDFCGMTNAGLEANFPMYNIVLPQIYFLDRGQCIETRLIAEPDGWFKLVAAKNNTGSDNGVNAYIDQMLAGCKTAGAFDERNYRTLPLRNLGEEIIIASGLRVMQKRSLIELKNCFPAEEKRIREFRVEGKRPHTALIPSSRDLSVVASFAALLEGIVFWLTE